MDFLTNPREVIKQKDDTQEIEIIPGILNSIPEILQQADRLFNASGYSDSFKSFAAEAEKVEINERLYKLNQLSNTIFLSIRGIEVIVSLLDLPDKTKQEITHCLRLLKSSKLELDRQIEIIGILTNGRQSQEINSLNNLEG